MSLPLAQLDLNIKKAPGLSVVGQFVGIEPMPRTWGEHEQLPSSDSRVVLLVSGEYGTSWKLSFKIEWLQWNGIETGSSAKPVSQGDGLVG